MTSCVVLQMKWTFGSFDRYVGRHANDICTQYVWYQNSNSGFHGDDLEWMNLMNSRSNYRDLFDDLLTDAIKSLLKIKRKDFDEVKVKNLAACIIRETLFQMPYSKAYILSQRAALFFCGNIEKALYHMLSLQNDPSVWQANEIIWDFRNQTYKYNLCTYDNK